MIFRSAIIVSLSAVFLTACGENSTVDAGLEPTPASIVNGVEPKPAPASIVDNTKPTPKPTPASIVDNDEPKPTAFLSSSEVIAKFNGLGDQQQPIFLADLSTEEAVRLSSIRAAADGFANLKAAPSAIDLNPSTTAEVADLRKFDTPIRNQGSRGTCTAFGTIGVLENLAKQRWGKDLDLSEEHLWSKYRFPYTQYAMRSAMSTFIVSEAVYPYNGRQEYPKRVDEARDGIIKAGQFTSVAVSPTSIMETLKGGSPVLFAFEVNTSFMRTTDGVVNPNDTSVVGGHAVELVGEVKDPSLQRFGGGYYIIKNSWSVQVGDHGYYYLPFSYCRTHTCYESYSLKKEQLISNTADLPKIAISASFI